LPKQGFAEELAKITGASIEEAKAKEVWIRSAYQNDILHLTSKPSLREETQPKQESKKESEYIELSAGEIHLKLPLTEEGIEALEAAITILKNKLQQTTK
ncbi:MAG: hypothetical protein ACK4TI_02835, partial [Nitrososphaerales archaeon]